MKKYILVYNVETEETVSHGYVFEEDAALQANEGEAVVTSDTPLSRDTHYVVGGVLNEYTPEQIELRANRPSWHYRWSNASMAWEDTRSLERFKEVKWAAIKAMRDMVADGGFTWDGSTFQSDAAKSRGEITGAALAATIAKTTGQPFSITWTLTDNTTRTLTADQMIAVGFAMLAHINAVHETGRALRAAIDAATTATELEAITW